MHLCARLPQPDYCFSPLYCLFCSGRGGFGGLNCAGGRHENINYEKELNSFQSFLQKGRPRRILAHKLAIIIISGCNANYFHFCCIARGLALSCSLFCSLFLSFSSSAQYACPVLTQRCCAAGPCCAKTWRTTSQSRRASLQRSSILPRRSAPAKSRSPARLAECAFVFAVQERLICLRLSASSHVRS